MKLSSYLKLERVKPFYSNNKSPRPLILERTKPSSDSIIDRETRQ